MPRLINYQPGRPLKVALGIIPFLLVLLLYQISSDIRKAENEQDRLLPSFTEIAAGIDRMAFEPSQRTGEYLFWEDTRSSLTRLAIGIAIAAFVGLLVGLAAGSIPIVAAPLSPLITAISLVPPMAILPILFIVFGLGELSKVMLIVIGVCPFLIRDMLQRVQEIPREQLVKAQTLGGDSWQIILRVILPQILPRLFDGGAIESWCRLVVPDRCGGNRLNRWPGVPHLSGTALYVHGCDIALCGLDHLPGIHDQLVSVENQQGTVLLVFRREVRQQVSTFIQLEKLSKGYGDNIVLENLSCEVAEGEFVTLVGTSGCGKSTFLKLLLGTEQADSGKLLMDGKPIGGEPSAERGIVFQKYSVFPHLTVRENVVLGREFSGSKWLGRLFGKRRKQALAEADKLLCSVGLEQALDKFPHELSGGMQAAAGIGSGSDQETQDPVTG